MHDTSISSVSITTPGDLDLDSMQTWIGDILQTKGADIYRMKGVLAVAHAKERFVYQAVHMIFNGNFEEPWGPEEPHENKLVFIGKNLNREELKASFEACLVTPENMEKKKQSLRFAVGDAVQCRTGSNSWSKGKVVDLLYREEFMPPGMVAPYQVELEDGALIFAPRDEDPVIRKA